MENEFFRFKIHPWILVNITHRISFKNPHLHFPQTIHTFGSDFIIVINWAILNLFVTQTACTFTGTREFLSYRPRGGTSLYKPYGYVSPHWVEFLVLCPFWSGIGYDLRGNYRSVWMYLLFQFHMNKNEVEICEFKTHSTKVFVRTLI